MMASGQAEDSMETDRASVSLGAAAAETFDARVEPVWHDYRRRESRLGFWRRRRIRLEIRHMVGSINGWLDLTGSGVPGWDRREGTRACRLQVPKKCLVASFQEYLARRAGEVARTWRHLMALRDSRSIVILGDFRLPFPVSAGRRDEVVWVTSSERVRAELAEVDACLSVERALAAATGIRTWEALVEVLAFPKFRDSLRDDHLPHLTYTLLKELAQVSVARGLPGFIGSPRDLWEGA